VQDGVAEAWKDNLLDELAKGESEEGIWEEFRQVQGETQTQWT